MAEKPVEPNYDIPMSGLIPVQWNLGMDENGEISGFIGIPKDGKAARLGEDEYESVGCTIGFSRSIRGFDAYEMKLAVEMAWTHALNSHIMPRLLEERNRLLGACLEMQRRVGGYEPEPDEPPAGE